jgi:AcrR family transcriptional regulator
MPPQTTPSERRTPRQQRSRELVERVLDTAERLLAEDEAASLSTTRIAQTAGVSVGSIYQYFPDTAAIVAALAQRYMDGFEVLMERAVEAAGSGDWDDPVGALVDAVAARYRDQPGYRALWFGPHLSPELRQADRQNKLRLADGVRRVLLNLGLARDDSHLVSVCQAAVHACDALLQEAFRRDPDGDPPLLEETKAILRAYLAQVTAHYAHQGGNR